MRSLTITCVALGCALAAFVMFQMLRSPDHRVAYMIVFAGCVLVVAAALYVMPPRGQP